MLPLRLFRKRNFTFANLETVTVYAGLSCLTFFLVLFLQQLAGYSALQSGLVLVPITVVMFVLSPRVGRLVDALRAALVHGRRAARRRGCAPPDRRLAPDFTYWLDLAAAAARSSRSASR